VPAIAAATTRPLRDALGPRIVVGERPVLAAGAPGVAFLTRRRRRAREAVEALHDVAEEARLALLTVRHDVDARLGLLPDDVGDRVPDQLGEGLGIVGLPAVLRSEQGDERLGPGQAADVCRQDPFRASFHRSSPYHIWSVETVSSR